MAGKRLGKQGRRLEECVHSLLLKLLIFPDSLKKVCSVPGVCLWLTGKPVPGLHIM